MPRPARWGLLAAVAVVAILPATWPAAWPAATEPIRSADAWDASWAGFDAAFPANRTAFLSFEGGAWIELHYPDRLAWFVQPYPVANGTALQVEQQRAGLVEKGLFANIRDGPNDAEHPIPPWVRQIVVVENNPGGGPAFYLSDAVHLQHTRLPGGLSVSWFDPTGLASIERTLPWWGRIQPAGDPAVAPPS